MPMERVTVSHTITASELNELAYQYKYDARDRLIEKKTPGKGWEYIVYDQLNRPVLTQDANLKAANKWLFSKYDAFGRVAYTGLYLYVPTSTSARIELQNLVNNQADPIWNEDKRTQPASDGSDVLNGVHIEYTNNAYPNTNIELHTVNVYDSYVASENTPQIIQSYLFGQTTTTNTKSLPTIHKTRVLETEDWIISMILYDDKARAIYTQSKNNYLNTFDISASKLDFTGKIIESINHHKKDTNSAIVIHDAYTYDHAQRLLTQVQRINGQTPELIVNNHYDALGRLERKDVGGAVATTPENSNGLQTIDYAYNIRGWLKRINTPGALGDDLFGFELNYNTPQGPSSWYNNPIYNGNISHVTWQTNNIDTKQRHYSYKYDAMNRFQYAYYGENSQYTHKYNAYIYGYDRNGNIETLYRSGQNPNNQNTSYSMDYLKYTYDEGNQLTGVKDHYNNTTSNSMGGFKDGNTTPVDYAYDTNGNMTVDKNKNITSIHYNHLNLPTKIVFNNDDPAFSRTPKAIEYTYDATGVKLSKKVNENFNITNTQYAGNYIYENSTLKFFSHPEGYVEPSTNWF